MNKLMLSLGLILIGVVAQAQVETVITTVTELNGQDHVVGIEYKDYVPRVRYDSFQQADKNSDGCLDRQEAKDMGILDFNRYAKVNRRCLNEAEYHSAMKGA